MNFDNDVTEIARKSTMCQGKEKIALPRMRGKKNLWQLSCQKWRGKRKKKKRC